MKRYILIFIIISISLLLIGNVNAYDKTQISEKLKSQNWEIRLEALKVIDKFVDNRQQKINISLIDKIIDIMLKEKKDEVRQEAEKVIKKIDKSVVGDVFYKKWEEYEKDKKVKAVNILSDIGSEGIPGLLNVLKRENNDEIKRTIIEKLQQVEKVNKEIICSLLQYRNRTSNKLKVALSAANALNNLSSRSTINDNEIS